jgi:hypothetical protein
MLLALANSKPCEVLHVSATTTPVSLLLAEITGGQGLSLTQAARRFPPHRRNRPVCASTIWRWVHDGVRVPDGQVVRLEAARVCGRWLTSEPALQRFIAAQTPKTGGPVSPARRTPTMRQRAIQRAVRKLEDQQI